MTIQLTIEGARELLDGVFGTGLAPTAISMFIRDGISYISGAEVVQDVGVSGNMTRAIMGTSDLLSPCPFSSLTTNIQGNIRPTTKGSWNARNSAGTIKLNSNVSAFSEMLTNPQHNNSNVLHAPATLNSISLTVPGAFGLMAINTTLRNEMCNIIVRGERETKPWLVAAYVTFYNVTGSATALASPTSLSNCIRLGTVAIGATNFLISGLGSAQLRAPILVSVSPGLGGDPVITHAVVTRDAPPDITTGYSLPASAMYCPAGLTAGNIRTDVNTPKENGGFFNIVAFNLAFA